MLDKVLILQALFNIKYVSQAVAIAFCERIPDLIEVFSLHDLAIRIDVLLSAEVNELLSCFDAANC